ncbi:hypothetical protein Dimus_017969 [Dionaea muscipula]
MAAYSTGYLDGIIVKGSRSPMESAKISNYDKDSQKKPLNDEKISLISQKVGNPISSSVSEDSPSLVSNVENLEISGELQTHDAPVEDQSKNQAETLFPAESERKSESTESYFSLQEELPKPSQGEDPQATRDQILEFKHLLDENVDRESLAEKATMEHDERAESVPISKGATPDASEQFISEGDSKELPNQAEEPPTPSSLLDAYHLGGEASEKPNASLTEKKIPEITHSSLQEASVGAARDSSDAYVAKDGKLMMDFLQAIHAAEQRQAEIDAQIFSEEKRMIKEKYDKKLKDARARELMYAEEAAIMDKEIKKERVKAAVALKALQEKTEERLKLELEQKEKEAELKLKEVQEFAKAELAAAIAQEKASQIVKMEEANLNINALLMAFYARSEEARQNHSIHKLALGALALEDALSNGIPIQRELDVLRPHLEGVDKDLLLDLALSSLPEDTRTHGADTLLQLNEKFDVLKKKLRHFSFLPPDGGGLLAHSLAHVASLLKVKEAGQRGDGIESVINRVEILLTEGRVAEAADALENGVEGSAAAEIVSDWVRRARNRAVTEQAVTLLQSYATSIGISLT